MKRFLLSLSCIALVFSCGATEKPSQNKNNPTYKAKAGYWQQHVDYQMEIDMDVSTFQYKGK